MGWFKFGDSNPTPNPTSVAASVMAPPPYHKRMEKAREKLHWLVKSYSNELSTEVYSEFRELEKVLTDINVFIEGHIANADDEHMLDSIMNDYIPSALELFVKLPENKRNDSGEGDTLLLKQCRTMARDLKNRNQDLHDRAEKNLRTQAAFIEERFNDNG